MNLSFFFLMPKNALINSALGLILHSKKSLAMTQTQAFGLSSCQWVGTISSCENLLWGQLM